MRTALRIAELIAILAFAALCAAAIWFLTQANDAMTRVVADVHATQVSVDTTSRDIAAQIGALNAATQTEILGMRRDLNVQLTQTHADIAPVVTSLDATLQQTAASERQITDTVAQLRLDVAPSIVGANLLMQRNALPAQLLGVLGATKVTMGHVAQTSAVVAQEAPRVAKSLSQTSDHVAGISADAHKLADKYTRPATWRGKLWGIFKLAAVVVTRAVL